MIPSMIVFGLLLGRWWAWALGAAAVGWPILLLLDGVMGLSVELLGAGALGAVNAAVGVAVHQGILRVVRRIIRRAGGVHAGSDARGGN